MKLAPVHHQWPVQRTVARSCCLYRLKSCMRMSARIILTTWRAATLIHGLVQDMCSTLSVSCMSHVQSTTFAQTLLNIVTAHSPQLPSLQQLQPRHSLPPLQQQLPLQPPLTTPIKITAFDNIMKKNKKHNKLLDNE